MKMNEGFGPQIPSAVTIALDEQEPMNGYAQLYIEDGGRCVVRGSRHVLQAVLALLEHAGIQVEFDEDVQWCG